jgi:putative proteasome-type protease
LTYCAALKLNDGMVFAADTRTNAGVDNVACFRKLYTWEKPGDRVIVMLTAGNLAVTQSVVALLNEQIDGREENAEHLHNTPTLFRAARIVGDALRSVRRVDGAALEASTGNFSASFLLGGQIRDEPPRLFNIYPEGNFIEATDDTPFFQIGEHKYGKPILDRVARSEMPLADGAKLILLSFDSTLRSNFSVGMPLDLLLYRTDALRIALAHRIEKDDPYFRRLSQGWSNALREAFNHLDGLDIAER